MIIAFKLSMPGVSSWDGKWSGGDRPHVIVKSYRKIPQPSGEDIAPKYYHYDFGDGWRAGVDAEVVDRGTATKLRNKSAGFCGYDWMVEEIITLGRIRTLKERMHP